MRRRAVALAALAALPLLGLAVPHERATVVAPRLTVVAAPDPADLPDRAQLARASRSRPSPTPKATNLPRKFSHRRRNIIPARVVRGATANSTAYCDTGIMADGQRTFRGAVAANAWPLGTRLRVSDGPYGPGIVVVRDRIGHGSELDFAMPGDCAGARRWGRRTIRVQVL